MLFDTYDVVVVGAGHAGSEAAAAAANMGSKVLLITMNLQTIAQMSCNPAMGGIAKGQIVREIDALGGYSGLVTDRTMIQFRMLNKSKGPAMWSPRAQSDRMLFAAEWRLMLEKLPNVHFWQDTVTGLLVKDKRVVGVKTAMGQEIPAKSVILTNGTFLNGIIHIGEKSFGGGRMGEKASSGITEQLNMLGFRSSRMKTGTPVRIDGRTIDFSKLTEQRGDEDIRGFSFLEKPVLKQQMSCWIAHTSKKVHDTLRLGFHLSPMFTGRIEGIGPRYCPSIEDKIDRFAGKDAHQLFAEPEGWNTVEYYLNGFSSSLPDYIQFKALRQIEGFEQARIFRPGYAIEYDYFPPEQLKHTLETKLIDNLYFAGQINGTTGYEEAAAQGIMAGINAHLRISESEPFVLGRDEAYIGVLIDDLITKGVDEPYRMFTSRAEHRILLRQDNADARLTEKSFRIGLADENRYKAFSEKQQKISALIGLLKNISVSPDSVNGILASKGTNPIQVKQKFAALLLRPQLGIFDLLPLFIEHSNISRADEHFIDILEATEIEIKYEGYIQKEREMAEKLNRLEHIVMHPDFDYHALQSLSYEAREKLSRIKPQTLGQASRISGISPSDIAVLAIYLGR
ncbi:MAG TPA: tRNA uridine-5-carboxymethylaminomethyl(34) synthesis enzyme MnmG [Bacteroidales bacterium]|nr:tRNA uridine-5-carboxymethylaminomethyl(34) synthesis enzyme MnmG [Bacteroidales bacterium]